VTGASKSIGAAIATYFAAEGAKVVVNYATSKASTDHVHGHEPVRAYWTSNGRK